MQRQRISLESLLHIVKDAQLNNFILFLEDYNKEYTIESHTTTEDNTQNTVDLIRRRVFMYPKDANFKIVLKPTPTANGTSVRTYFFSRTDQATPQPQPQAQNVGLGGVEGLGAIERMFETQNAIAKKEWENERKTLLEEFSLKLKKDRLNQQKAELRDERQAFEDSQKNAIAKKVGEGLGAALINFGMQHPALAGLLGQLGVAPAGLGAAETERDDEYNAKESIIEDLQDGSLSVEDLEQIVNSLKRQNGIQNQEQEQNDYE